MSQHFDVSIIIVNYNTFELTCSCIKSVKECTKGLTYEIILVDNASVECSPDLFLEKYPDLKLIKSPVNTGFTGGNNLGIEIAKGTAVLLLNSDVLLTENSILTCYNFLQTDSQTGVITCMLKSPNGNIQKQCQKFPSIFLTILEIFRIQKLIPQPKQGRLMGGGFSDHLSSGFCDSIWGTFFMFSRNVLNTFDDEKLPGDFFMYAEDLMWCYSIRKRGFQIYYDADTSVIHLLAASSSESVLKHKHQNEYYFMVKFYGLFYTKIYMLLRCILSYSLVTKQPYTNEIAGMYKNLFLRGKIPMLK